MHVPSGKIIICGQLSRELARSITVLIVFWREFGSSLHTYIGCVKLINSEIIEQLGYLFYSFLAYFWITHFPTVEEIQFHLSPKPTVGQTKWLISNQRMMNEVLILKLVPLLMLPDGRLFSRGGMIQKSTCHTSLALLVFEQF